VSIAKEEWELGHLKAMKEEDELRAEIEEDDMLYTSLHESLQNKTSSSGKPGKSKPKLYSYGGWEFESFDDDAVASFLDDDGSQQSLEDDAAFVEPILHNNQFVPVPRIRGRKKKADVTKRKPSNITKSDSSKAASPQKRKYWTKKRRAELSIDEGSVEKIVGVKRPKLPPRPLPPRIANLPRIPKLSRHITEEAESIAAAPVTLDGKHTGHTVRPQFISPPVIRPPRLKALKQFPRPPDVVQHRPLVRPIRSSELGIRPRMVRVPMTVPRMDARTIAEISAQSPPQPTPILEKLGASVMAGPSPANQPSRLSQIVSSISAAAALQNTVLANTSSSPGTIQYVITTNGRPPVQPVGQTPILVGTSGSPAGNLRTNVVYQVPGRQLPLQSSAQSVPAARPSQSTRFVHPSSVPASSAPRQSFVLTAPGGDRQSFLLLPTSNRQSYILAPAASASQPAVVTTAASPGTSSVLRPTTFSVQMSPPRLPRTLQQQQPIQPAPRTIQLAPSPQPPAANTLPILEKFALQLHSGQPATYEVVAHSGELIAATSPAKSALQQVVYPTVSPPSQIVRLSGSPRTNNLQLVNHMVVGASVAKPVQTITLPQFVIRQPRQVAPVSSIINASPAVLPVRNQLSGPRLVSSTNLVPVPTSQLSTVIIVDGRPNSQNSSATARQS